MASIVRALAILTIAGRTGGFAATWIAPPPMIAPPTVHAQSFAKAILTDIVITLFTATGRKELLLFRTFFVIAANPQ
ncbi:MAG TPA: hypothetical protein VF628_13755 [Allosphingosinicella sp.]